MSLVNVYVSIGNSDDKLTQEEWARYAKFIEEQVRSACDQVHGVWFSHSASPWQNMCIAFDVQDQNVWRLKAEIAAIGSIFKQDSVAWMQGKTEFLHHDG